MLLSVTRGMLGLVSLLLHSDEVSSTHVLAGPMIRIIGDRLSGEIKAALLHTIGLLIAKAGPGLKPFVPQLQTTFLKCLGDQVCQWWHIAHACDFHASTHPPAFYPHTTLGNLAA